MGDKAYELQGDEEKAGGKILFRQGDFMAYIGSFTPTVPQSSPFLIPSPAHRFLSFPSISSSDAASLLLPLLPPPLHPTSPPLKPLLIIMSDSPTILPSFLALGAAHAQFEIVQLPVVSPSSSGHSEQEFIALPRRDRVQLTEGFVRDMTMMGREVDGFVGTGSSNVGDMISLLVGGERAVKGEVVRSL